MPEEYLDALLVSLNYTLINGLKKYPTGHRSAGGINVPVLLPFRHVLSHALDGVLGIRLDHDSAQGSYLGNEFPFMDNDSYLGCDNPST